MSKCHIVENHMPWLIFKHFVAIPGRCLFIIMLRKSTRMKYYLKMCLDSVVHFNADFFIFLIPVTLACLEKQHRQLTSCSAKHWPQDYHFFFHEQEIPIVH